ncbi:RICIN domain-containing protein [Hymenobacter terrenus]|uniref:RICIN domain-containing protein n=1 Tax=Hymenobacter terrenus TaxID=1629124 RepID=UPI0006970919|nr:RICIN domain-containing protein [Hymenobacter terrenus]
MKKKYQFGLGVAMLFVGLGAQAQNQPDGPSYFLGTSQTLVKQLEAQKVTGTAQRGGSTVTLRVSAAQTFTGKVNYRQDLSKTGEYVVGEIQDVPGSSFQLRVEDKEVQGNIVLRSSKKAYRYSADALGNVSVQEVDINKVLCIDYSQPEGYRNPSPTSNTANRAAVVSLQSFPGARGCILLDVDGQYVSGTLWNKGNPINAAPSGMNDAAVRELWELVSEDFRPFSMNVTTDESVFNSYPKNMRRRCIISPTNTAAPGAGGVAYVGSFNWNDDTPCWVFITSAKSGGEAASHEVGHTLGLGHDGRISPDEGYYSGQGNWAPIMGVGYYKPISQWSRGEYNSANQKQDDLAIMAGSTYNLGYRNDDHSNGTAGATNLGRNGTSLSGGGVIERNNDQDFFVFTAGAGTINLNVNTVGRHGNLDIVARLYNGGGALIGTYDANGLNTSLNVNVVAGTYYLSVDGTGAGNPATDGYSDYASLGTFSISGTAPVGGGGTSNGVATVYRDCNYGSTATALEAGEFTLGALQSRGIINDDISSLKVNSGYEVQLFEDDNFQGASIVINANNSCLVSNWNDRASSLKVRATGVINLSGTYTLQNRNSGLMLDVDAVSMADGANVHQWTANSCECQQFRFTHLGGGVYQIIAVHSGKALDVQDASLTDGGNVQQWGYVGGANQQFIVQSAGDGFYRLIVKHSNKAVEVAESRTNTGANVRQWTENSSPTQQWKLTAVTNSFSTVIQAEAYSAMSNIITEPTTDAGGGQNVGGIETADYMAYNNITIPTTGNYTVEYRVASPDGGRLSLDVEAGKNVLGMLDLPKTGGWQDWTTVSHTVTINAGTYNFGIYAQAGGWNLNWFRISKAAAGSVAETTPLAQPLAPLELYPNPVADQLKLNSAVDLAGGQISIIGVEGKEVWHGTYAGETVDVSTLKPGLYTLVVYTKDQHKLISRFSKQ